MILQKFNLFNLGIKETDSFVMRSNKKITNQVSLLCASTGFFYSPFLYVHYPQIVVYPISLFFVSLGILWLSHLGAFQLSRFLTAFQMLVHASLFHASIIPVSDFMLVPFFSTMIAMTIIPWVLYAMEEKGMLVLTSLICFGLIFSQEFMNKQIELEIDPTFYRESYLNPMTYGFAVGIGVILLYLIKVNQINKET